MKSTVLLLATMIAFIASTAWIAQEWRLEGVQYEKAKERDGDILRQQFVSEGEKTKAEIVAERRRQGTVDAARILAETESQGRMKVAASEEERTKRAQAGAIATGDHVMTPLQGTELTQAQFLERSKTANDPKERDLYATIFKIVRWAHLRVNADYQEYLGSLSDAMSEKSCEDGEPRSPR